MNRLDNISDYRVRNVKRIDRAQQQIYFHQIYTTSVPFRSCISARPGLGISIIGVGISTLRQSVKRRISRFHPVRQLRFFSFHDT
jgi:hypothetical protein